MRNEGKPKGRSFANGGGAGFPVRMLGWIAICGMVGLGIAAPGPFLAGAEREFPNLVALGRTHAVGSSQGLPTTIVYFDHESGNHYGQGKLKLRLDTVVLTAEMAHPLTPSFSVAYGSRLVALVEGAPFSLYRDGEHLDAITFRGNSGGVALMGRWFPENPWGFDLEAEHRGHHFSPNEDTVPGFNLPPDFGLNEARGVVHRHGWWGEEEARLTLKAVWGARSGFRDWELDPEAEEKTRYTRQELYLEQPFTWSEFQHTLIDLRGGAGRHLDQFSGFGVGGAFGQNPLPGYFRNEYRPRRFGVLSVSHRFTFAEDRLLTLLAGGAWLQEMDLSFLEGPPPSRTLGSVGFRIRIGIRAWGGLPVIFGVYEGLNVPESSLEDHRREAILIVAAGF